MRAAGQARPKVAVIKFQEKQANTVMNSKIKIGDVIFEVPAGSSAAGQSKGVPPPIQASKPETPEPLEESPYVYRPNDAFQSVVDEARAIASINSGQKSWVIKTWFVLFVLGPLFYAQCFVLAYAQYRQGWYWIRTIATLNLLILPLWSLYYGIWLRRMKKEIGPIKMIGMIAPIIACGAILAFAPNGGPPAPELPPDSAGIAQVRAEGADLNKLHRVEFFLFLQTEADAQGVAQRLESRGFQVAVSFSANSSLQWQLVAARSMLLDEKELKRIRRELTDLADSASGVYDGWETQAVH
jgi:hypothetical protein